MRKETCPYRVEKTQEQYVNGKGNVCVKTYEEFATCYGSNCPYYISYQYNKPYCKRVKREFQEKD